MIGIWYLFSYVYTAFLVPPPHEVGVALFYLVMDRGFLLDTLLTVSKTLVAIIIGCAIGIPLGMLLGYNRNFYNIFNPDVDFLRSIPTIAAFPIFLLIFGVTDLGRIALAVFSGSLIITIGSMNGVKNANEDRKRAAKSMKATNFQLFRDVLFFEALPQISTAIKQALSLVLIIVLVTEMLFGGTTGLGYRIINYYNLYQIPQMYAAIVMGGLIGFSLNWAYGKFEETKLIRWKKGIKEKGPSIIGRLIGFIKRELKKKIKISTRLAS